MRVMREFPLQSAKKYRIDRGGLVRPKFGALANGSEAVMADLIVKLEMAPIDTTVIDVLRSCIGRVVNDELLEEIAAETERRVVASIKVS